LDKDYVLSSGESFSNSNTRFDLNWTDASFSDNEFSSTYERTQQDFDEVLPSAQKLTESTILPEQPKTQLAG